MGLWGTTTADGDKPKFLPVDSNAAGSSGARENIIAVKGGWGLSPGLAASGNDNTDAQPEVLVCVKNIAEAMGNASVIGLDWTDATVATAGLFDLTVTFDEAVDITSAAWSNNQTVTNKAYILLARLGVTDMASDSTIAAQYFSGSGTNQLVFRGRVTTNAAAGYIGFNKLAIVFDGTATLDEEDGRSSLAMRQEAGTASAPTLGDRIIMNGTAAASVTVNGALTQSTTLVIDGLSGAALAVGQVVTVNGAGGTPAASITDADGNTGLSTDNSLTITAVASVTSCTVSEPITVANNIVLLTSTNGGEEIIADSLDFTAGGPLYDTRSDIKTVTRTGADSSVAVQLESATTDLAGVAAHDSNASLVQESGNAASQDSDDRNSEVVLGDPYVVETALNDAATYLESGSTSGTANILKGIDVAAA